MTATRPNILLFLPDQHRADWTGLNPSLPLRTPNLDHLAARGTRFTNAITPSPLCAPARACLAAGLCYERCRVPDNRCDYPLDQPTYYQSLRNRGYRVAGVGKFDLHKDTRDPASMDWHLDGSRLLREWGFTDGIDNEGKFDGSSSFCLAGKPRGPYLQALHQRGLAHAYVTEHQRISENMGAYVTELPEELYCDNWLSENGLAILRAFPDNTPWHMVVNFTGPHNPMDVTARMHQRWAGTQFPPPRNNEHPDRDGLLRNRQHYAAMIENIDRQMGRFIDVVTARGELNDTLVVYASDHGEMLGDHQRWGKGTWRHPSVAIPMVLAGPNIAAGAVRTEPVSLHDLCATFMAASGSVPPPTMDVVSLLPSLAGSPEPARTVVTSGLGPWRMAFDGRHKLILEQDAEPRFFDLADDPWEENNMGRTHPGAFTRLAAEIAAVAGPEWAAAAGA